MVVASVPQTVASQFGPGAARVGLCAEQREDRGPERRLWTVRPWGILEGGGVAWSCQEEGSHWPGGTGAPTSPPGVIS